MNYTDELKTKKALYVCVQGFFRILVREADYAFTTQLCVSAILP